MRVAPVIAVERQVDLGGGVLWQGDPRRQCRLSPPLATRSLSMPAPTPTPPTATPPDPAGVLAPLETASAFEHQRDRTHRTLLFLCLGLLWVGLLGFWAGAANAVAYGVAAEMVTGEPVISDVTVLWLGRWSAGVLLAVWAAVAGWFSWRAGLTLPRLVGACAAGADEGPEGRRLAGLLRGVLLAASLPVELNDRLELYVWETPAANAFAAGRSLANGSIVVTRGLLKALTDDELEAVLAHEVAHLKHRDTLYVAQALAVAWMVVLVVILTLGIGAAAIALFVAAVALGFYVVAAMCEGEGGCIVALIGGTVVVAGAIYFGLFLIMLLLFYAALSAVVLLVAGLSIRSAATAVSQSREYLADAAAAQWTRRPDAVASALRKIGSVTAPRRTREMLLHPLMIRGTPDDGSSFLQQCIDLLMKTHPRLEHRIAVLEEMAGSSVQVDPCVRRRLAHSRIWRVLEWAAPLALTAALTVASLYGIYLLMQGG